MPTVASEVDTSSLPVHVPQVPDALQHRPLGHADASWRDLAPRLHRDRHRRKDALCREQRLPALLLSPSGLFSKWGASTALEFSRHAFARFQIRSSITFSDSKHFQTDSIFYADGHRSMQPEKSENLSSLASRAFLLSHLRVDAVKLKARDTS